MQTAKKSSLTRSALIIILIVNVTLLIFGFTYWRFQNDTVLEFHESSKMYHLNILEDEQKSLKDELRQKIEVATAIISYGLAEGREFRFELLVPILKKSLENINELVALEITDGEVRLFRAFKKGNSIGVMENPMRDVKLILYETIEKEFEKNGKKLKVTSYYTTAFVSMEAENAYRESIENYFTFEDSYKKSDRFLNLTFLLQFLAISFAISSFVYIFLRRVEKRLVIAQNEMRRKNSDLERTLRKLRRSQSQLIEAEKMASLGQMVAGISHEINTPLGVALTASTKSESILKKLKSGFEERSLSDADIIKSIDRSNNGLELVVANLERARILINSFKQVAVDRSSGEKRKIDLKEYIESVVKSLSPSFDKRRYRVHVSGSDDLVLTTYGGAISQIVTNLIQNSIKHGFRGMQSGMIEISLKKLNGYIEMEYRDNGVGIDAALRGRIFEPFSTTAKESGGSGLGMNIVYNLVKVRLQGEISLVDTEAGVAFLITLPLEIIEEE